MQITTIHPNEPERIAGARGLPRSHVGHSVAQPQPKASRSSSSSSSSFVLETSETLFEHEDEDEGRGRNLRAACVQVALLHDRAAKNSVAAFGLAVSMQFNHEWTWRGLEARFNDSTIQRFNDSTPSAVAPVPFVLLSRKVFAGCANFSSELQEGRNMEAERYSLTLHFSASLFLPLSVAGPASPSSLGVLRSTSFGCGGAAPGPFVVELNRYG